MSDDEPEWREDCGGDKVLDVESFARLYGVAYPDGTASYSLYVCGHRVMDRSEDLATQAEAMVCIERFAKEQGKRVTKALRAEFGL